MRNIIRYYANLEIMGYIFFGGQIFLYMVIAYINGVDSIKISMLAQVLVASFIMSIVNGFIFDSSVIKERLKIFTSYILLLLIIMFFSIKFLWIKELRISEMNVFIIYTISYITVYLVYKEYLKMVGEHYTNSLKIYQERKRR